MIHAKQTLEHLIELVFGDVVSIGGINCLDGLLGLLTVEDDVDIYWPEKVVKECSDIVWCKTACSLGVVAVEDLVDVTFQDLLLYWGVGLVHVRLFFKNMIIKL